LNRVIELRNLFGDTPIRLLQTTRLERVQGTPERRAEYLARHHIDGINLHRSDWNGGLVALFHRFGLVTFGWDMQQEHELRAGLRMGLDAVYSDRVDVMADAFREEIGNPLV
jgi:glycerophosphoryl diester phosphodiesterase